MRPDGDLPHASHADLVTQNAEWRTHWRIQRECTLFIGARIALPMTRRVHPPFPEGIAYSTQSISEEGAAPSRRTREQHSGPSVQLMDASY